MKALLISDTHGHLPPLDLKGIDVVFHCGDITFKQKNDYTGQLAQFENEFCPWVRRIYDEGVDFFFCWGNHETFVESLYIGSDFNDVTRRSLLTAGYHTTYRGFVITGFEYTPYYCGWAFNEGDNPYSLGKLCKQISVDTDILLSHGPPRGILDWVDDGINQGFGNYGSTELLKYIKTLPRLKLHAFGHLHHCGGRQDTLNGIKFVNCSYLDDNYNICGHNGIIVEI